VKGKNEIELIKQKHHINLKTRMTRIVTSRCHPTPQACCLQVSDQAQVALGDFLLNFATMENLSSYQRLGF